MDNPNLTLAALAVLGIAFSTLLSMLLVAAKRLGEVAKKAKEVRLDPCPPNVPYVAQTPQKAPQGHYLAPMPGQSMTAPSYWTGKTGP